ncbi:MAG: transcriptional regulator [Elusimicrobia bacterium RIFOXYB2_FULL_49_7]|nr:MAG: transcriptional regulator [Elusimicrobia bacterium RIFOXYB2_FULL_49_7]
MSGHSKWATIKRKKGAADAKRGQIFTKIIREITTSARLGGGVIEANPRLRLAVQNAKDNNMPAKNIENAILKGSGQLEGVTYEEITYEGYGPGGIAIIIEAMTDNKNRTVSDIRHILTKHNGNLGETGTVGWMFKTVGLIVVEAGKIGEDELMELVIEAGADDMETGDEAYEIKTSLDKFEAVRAAIEKKGITPVSAEITKLSQNSIKVEGDAAAKIMKLVELLEDHDDVQHVYANYDIDDKEMDSLAK